MFNLKHDRLPAGSLIRICEDYTPAGKRDPLVQGELWEFTQRQRVRVGSKIATYLISGPALILGVQRNGDGGGDYYEILWGGNREEIIDRPPWNYFGERIS